MLKRFGICMGTILIAVGLAFEHISGSDEAVKIVEQEEMAASETVINDVIEEHKGEETVDELETLAVDDEPRIETIHLVSVGDIMMHSDEINCGYNSGTGDYQYDFMFEEVKPYLAAGDITIGNLEFTMAGKEKGYSGYPMFNAPSEIADAIKEAGIDVLSTANNHSLDRYYAGLSHTIDVLDHRGLMHTGTYKTKEETSQILYMTVKDTKFAFLSYTYGTNGIKADKGKEFCVNYIDKNKIKADIERARSGGGEVICVSMHWGAEYVTKPNKEQENLADFLIENGVDIILGGHPHVLEPMEIRRTNFNGKEKDVVLLYSQGNFISGQRDRYKDTGAIFNIFLEKNFETGVISVQNVSFIPTWVDQKNMKGQTMYRVLAAKRSIHMYETSQDGDISKNDYERLKRSLSDARSILEGSDPRMGEMLTYAD